MAESLKSNEIVGDNYKHTASAYQILPPVTPRKVLNCRTDNYSLQIVAETIISHLNEESISIIHSVLV